MLRFLLNVTGYMIDWDTLEQRILSMIREIRAHCMKHLLYLFIIYVYFREKNGVP